MIDKRTADLRYLEEEVVLSIFEQVCTTVLFIHEHKLI